MKVLIGTTNPAKLKMFQEALSGYDAELVSLTDLGITDEPTETGANPGENAAIKAAFYGKYADYVIGNDAGLYFDALALDDPRQPGLHIRTPNGKRLDDEEMIEYYCDLVHSLGGKVMAYYLDGFAVKTPQGVTSFQKSKVHARQSAFWMVDQPVNKRRPGWPLDSLTYYPQLGKYRSELTDNEVETVRYETDRAAEQDHRAMLRWLHEGIRRYCK